ncbi:MAG: hypothetical protein MTP17_04740 [Candidatus Midichloria sp.]|nr:MAG: hypothetical protein MTP17_04740 [Candidatus Midichloria sp.]
MYTRSIGFIKVIVQGKYVLEYEDSGLKTVMWVSYQTVRYRFIYVGDGMIGCDDESCDDSAIDNPGVEFCAYDNLRIMTSVENVLDYLSC